VAARLVRWALVKDYGLKFFYHSPSSKPGHRRQQGDAHAGLLRQRAAHRGCDEVKGFAMCGEDKQWHWAQAQIVGNDQVQVWSDKVPAPIAVRYAWADNPVCNLYSKDGLPVTPFRSDDFDMVTKPKAPVVAPAAVKPPAPPQPAAAPAPKRRRETFAHTHRENRPPRPRLSISRQPSGSRPSQ